MVPGNCFGACEVGALVHVTAVAFTACLLGSKGSSNAVAEVVAHAGRHAPRATIASCMKFQD